MQCLYQDTLNKLKFLNLGDRKNTQFNNKYSENGLIKKIRGFLLGAMLRVGHFKIQISIYQLYSYKYYTFFKPLTNQMIFLHQEIA